MTNFPDDNVLIERCQKGDPDALDMLVRKHERRAYQYAYRLTTNPEEAADVVADAFVRVYSALKNFKGQSAFTTWLYRILTNCFLDMKKREKNRQALSLESVLTTDDGEVERQVEDTGPTPGDVAERNEREKAVVEALARLPEYQQAMITMYHAEMLSYEEISEALDLREILAGDEELFRL